MIKQIKAHLNNSIQSIISQKVEFVKQDEQAFTRKRSLSLETMIRTILGMGGKSLSGVISVFLEIPWIQKPLSKPKRMLNPIISCI